MTKHVRCLALVVTLVFLAGSIAACTGPSPTSTPTAPQSEAFSAPGRGPITYSVSPLSLDAFSSIMPLGNLNPPSHTFPSNHIYFVLNPGVWEIRAPADGIITGLRSETSNDYNIYIAHTSTFETQFRHVEKLADWILNQTGQLEPAGEMDEPQIKKIIDAVHEIWQRI